MCKKSTCMWLVIGGLLGFVATNSALGADNGFPLKPIELVCHRTGGTTYLGAKIFAETLQQLIGTPIVLITKPAGAGTAAPVYVAKSKPDGYTLLVANSGINGTMPAILPVEYKNSEFEYLVLYGTQPIALAVKNDAPWRTLKELVTDAKKQPGKLKYSTSSVGAQSHFVMELFKMAAGRLEIDQVPFKSGPEGVTALLGGHVHVASTYLAEVKGLVDAGSLRLLAVPEERRLPNYPEVPTFIESGYPEVKSFAWYGIASPIGVSKTTSDRLKDALYKTAKHPEVEKQLVNIGYNAAFKTAEDFSKFVLEEEKVFRRIAKEANIKTE